jgi:hypothetical protein
LMRSGEGSRLRRSPEASLTGSDRLRQRGAPAIGAQSCAERRLVGHAGLREQLREGVFALPQPTASGLQRRRLLGAVGACATMTPPDRADSARAIARARARCRRVPRAHACSIPSRCVPLRDLTAQLPARLEKFRLAADGLASAGASWWPLRHRPGMNLPLIPLLAPSDVRDPGRPSTPAHAAAAILRFWRASRGFP